MWKLIIILSCVASVWCAAVPKDELPEIDGRIVGGRPVPIDWFPWQVSLQHYGQHYCGGSIYDNVTIITAAHCVVNVYSNLTIRAGSAYWNSGGVVKTAIHSIHHGSYNGYTKDFDIAVLRLDSPLAFYSDIQPIALAEQEPPNNSYGAVSGWGHTSFGSNVVSELQAVSLTIVRRTECANSYNYYSYDITERMICTYTPGKDACQGDSGGPLINENFKLVGVVSWGHGCAFPNYPGVYASVPVLRDWILGTVNELHALYPNN